MTNHKVNASFPSILAPIFKPQRYKVLYGGRGGGKSWNVARALLIEGVNQPLRILCAREIQRTINDSVHRLLSDQIEALGLGEFYEVTQQAIRGANGTEFFFVGLRHQDAHKIKSYEGVDRVWCEEAHTITKRSWSILIPTIRAEGSEIWVTFNPDLDTDETYQRFVVHPPQDAIVIKVGFEDNPWFPDVLERERLQLFEQDPDEHDHIWGGKPKTVVEGAIYAREVIALIENQQVRNVPYDPMLKVHTIWDLGWNDQTSIIFAQRLHSELRIILYYEDSFKTLAMWVKDLQELPYVWGQDWLPHDARQRDLKTGKSSEEVLKALGRKPRIIPQLPVSEGIKAARMLFPRTYMDETKCKRLLECLKRYRRHIPTTTEEPASPLHDEYSHGADAWRGLGIIVDQMSNDEAKRPLPYVASYGPAVPGVM